MERLPIIGITMGDPASIGPEISLKALNKKEIYEKCRPIIVGDSSVIEKAKEYTGLNNLKINSISKVSDALFEHGTIDVYDMNLVNVSDLELGKVSSAAGNAAFQYVKKVIELAMNNEIDATVTNALNKEAINVAGHHFSGHTEIYAHYTDTKKYTMMLAHENLRVVHVILMYL